MEEHPRGDIEKDKWTEKVHGREKDSKRQRERQAATCQLMMTSLVAKQSRGRCL